MLRTEATRRRRTRAVLATAVLATVVALQPLGAAPASAVDTVTDLGVLSGMSSSHALAINGKDYVVGYSGTAAVAWRPDRTVFRLAGAPGASGSIAEDVNWGNYAVGWSMVSGRYIALLWGDLIGQGAVLAPNFSGDTKAMAINDAYEVYGVARDPGGSYWYPVQFVGQSAVRIPAPSIAVNPSVMGVSNRTSNNIVVGQTSGCPTNCGAFRSGFESGIGAPGSGGTMALSVASGSTQMTATAASDDARKIAGTATFGGSGTPPHHAVTWTAGTTPMGYPTWTLRDIGSIPTTDGSPPATRAEGVSPGGLMVVGVTNATVNSTRAYYWTPTTGFQVLTMLDATKTCSPQLIGATDVNNLGHIVGTSCARSGLPHAVMWRDVPPA
jgi:probable HAF family extracellular repeat protein